MDRKPLYVELPFRAKTYDVDFAGIVNNGVYIRWLEDLRLKLLDDYLPLEMLIERETIPVLRETKIRYLKPVHLIQRVVGRMWICEMGRVKFWLEAEFVVDDQIVADARQLGAFIHSIRRRPVAVPGELAEKYKETAFGRY